MFQAWDRSRKEPQPRPDVMEVDAAEEVQHPDWAAEVPELDRVLALFLNAD